jgi:hypothetical protein
LPLFIERRWLPAHHLGAGSGSHAVQKAKITVAFEEICEKEKDEKDDGGV